MQTIRFQELTPEVYSAESRDFQIIERVNDSIYNGIKNDADSIRYITNTRFIHSDLLPLLQTKLGFLSNSLLNNDELRYILRVFPYLMRNKGSLLAVKQLLNMCLKMRGVHGNYVISYSNTATVINGVYIDANTVIVGLDTLFNSTEILQELAEYLLPAGFSFYIYYYKNIGELDTLCFNDSIKILYSSINIMSQIRGSDVQYGGNNADPTQVMTLTDSLEASVLGAVDTMYIDSVDSEVDDNFLGIFDEESDLPSSGVSVGNSAIADGEMYYYSSSQWNKLTFLGSYPQLTLAEIPSPQPYDLAAITNNHKYLIYINSTEIECNYRGVYASTSSVSSPQNKDLICLMDGPDKYKYYESGTWHDANLVAEYSSTKQIQQAQTTTDYNLFIVNGANYYIYLNSTWKDYTHDLVQALYMLHQNTL